MNIRFAFTSVFLGAALFAASAAGQVASQPAPSGPPTVTGPSRIAIINIQQAILTTQEGKKLAAALQKEFAPRQKQIADDEQAVTNLQNQLKAGGNTMSQSAQAQLTQEITTKQRDLQQYSDNAQSDFQTAQTNLMNTVGGKMMPILANYAKEHGYTMVVDVSMSWPQSPVLYYNPGTEVTSDIVKLYDQKYPVAAPSAASKSSTTK